MGIYYRSDATTKELDNVGASMTEETKDLLGMVPSISSPLDLYLLANHMGYIVNNLADVLQQATETFIVNSSGLNFDPYACEPAEVSGLTLPDEAKQMVLELASKTAADLKRLAADVHQVSFLTQGFAA